MTDQARRDLFSSGELLSLAQASKRTPYTAEYLSFLARRGKLPAVKIARNWVTTGTAVANFLKEQQDRHRMFIAKLDEGGKEAA